MPADRLIVFTRYPEPGRTKTRLIGTLGPEGAADLQRAMTAYTLATARTLAGSGRVGVEVRFHGRNEAAMRRMFGEGVTYRDQGEGDLGDRMARSFDDAWQEGAGAVVVIGSDCPGIGADLLARAFDRVRDDPSGIVLGPALDGGYYLIGLGRAAPEIFRGVDWGTDAVLEQTLEAARRAGRPTYPLEVLADVDRPEDLEVWHAARISVIIPALDEERAIGRTIDSAMASGNPEVIVVDGGSGDRTAEVARGRGAIVIDGPRGRGSQMNRGAARARGEFLLFLHADTTLPPGYASLVARALERPGVVAGAFDLGIDDEGPIFRWVERLVAWRSRHLRLPYGDQAIHVAARTFRDAGGYPEQPIMEDVALVRRLAARGRIEIHPERARTSARRWSEHGFWKTTLINQLCLAGYQLGLPASRIATWRRRGAARAGSGE